MASDQERQNSLVITACFFTGISTIVVIARTFVRAVLIRKPGLDDYSMLVAIIFTMGYLAEIFVGKANHIGFPMKTLSFENMTNLLRTTLAIQVTYYVCITAIKISILCMYLRFAVTRSLNVLCICTILFHLLFFFICIGVTLSQCQPLHKMWDLTQAVDGVCINTTAFFYFTSGFNIVTDIWILVLPIKTLSGILRPRREKIALGIIFGVGMFATITSIIRLHTIYTYTLAQDLFRESILVNIWSILEINIGIICASVPALKPLFTPKVLREAAGRNKRTGYQYHSHERSGFNSNSSGSNGRKDNVFDLNSVGGQVKSKTMLQSTSRISGSEDSILGV
ncbi:integral membrane protein [Colletotrichum incanum]|uniref:Integral membrane protein n=1 Tax=Colletotrichum incanum TaxID=1573173 RepID=A0A166NDQ9_COLIC|nr:integral membrane protein [Colletotrichum incanum]OHW97005.1 integral membrane protein [Colletotrichum incanum]